MANRKLFVNIPVKDLPKARTFFNALGFEFNKQFSNDDAASMVVGPDNYFMLMTEPFFQTFTKRPLPERKTQTGAIFCLSTESRAEVDDFVGKALKAGATRAQEAPQDHGFMYGDSFYDLDGHAWEIMWMDPSAVQ